MARKKSSTPRSADAGASAPANPRTPLPTWLPHAIGATFVMIGAILHALSANHLIPPDTVAYLDLGSAIRDGNAERWVQGYWSPLYPLLIAVLDTIVHPSRVGMLELLHGVQVVLVALGAWLLWQMSKGITDIVRVIAIWSVYAFAVLAFDLVPLLTPDLLLLVTFMGVAYVETRGGGRGIVRGLLLGTAYLVKTSVLPWLGVLGILEIGREMWTARRVSTATTVTLATGALVVASWIGPMSAKAGYITTGTTAALNWDWYVRASDARTPDTHRGQHRAYQTVDIIAGQPITVARYADTTGTWAPWSDPSSWARGVRTATRVIQIDAPLVDVISQVLNGTIREIGRALLLLWPLLLIAVPAVLDWRKRRSGAEDAPIPKLAVAGVLGLAMFSLLHVEARLLMPYALMVALALIVIRSDVAMDALARRLLLVGSLLLAVDTGYWTQRKVSGQRSEMEMFDQRTAGLATLYASATGAERTGRVLVVGPVAGVMGDLWLAGQHVTAQVLPGSMEGGWSALPADAQIETLRQRYEQESPYIWFTTAAGELNILPMKELPKP